MIDLQWPSLCLAPAGGNSVLIIEREDDRQMESCTERRLLLMADVAGTIPLQPHLHGELMVHVTLSGPHQLGLGFTELLQVKVSRSLVRACKDSVTGASGTLDEAAMALLPNSIEACEGVRGDTFRSKSRAQLCDNDEYRWWGQFRASQIRETQLASVACEPSAVAIGGSLHVAAPQIGNIGHPINSQGRYNMTVMISENRGLSWSVLCSVFAGPSMNSNFAVHLRSGGEARDELLLHFERAGDDQLDMRAIRHS